MANCGREQVVPNNDKSAGPLSGLQAIVGLLAGVAALIYLTGGAALGLRLLWAGLPVLPVGQMPREFLFSLGAAQIILPALALGLVAGLVELGQDLRGLKEGHRSWSYAKQIPALRRTYIAFYGTIPFVLISPGVAVAITFDEAIEDETPFLAPLVIAAILSLSVWIVVARMSRLSKRPEEPVEPNREKMQGRAWFALLTGLWLSLALAIWLWLGPGENAPRYLGIVGAWAVAFLFTLLVVWIRSRVGNYSRDHPHATRLDPLLVAVSWGATALLAVPALIAVTAAWPLAPSVVCGKQDNNPKSLAAGDFVGETKDRVYIGDTAKRLISVPTSNVSRLLIGSDATKACE